MHDANVTGRDVCDVCRGERPAGWRHGRVDYARGGTPCDYRCRDCGATGCRLWRGYNVSRGELRCTTCTEREEGRAWSPDEKHSIKWSVAAVPTEDGCGYWGYTSVPAAGVAWWERLPLRPERGAARAEGTVGDGQ